MMTIEIESIPVHFFTSKEWNESDIELLQGWKYWAETGYQSNWYQTLAEAIAAAKSEIQNLVVEFGSLPLFPVWIDDSWLEISEEF